MDTDDEEEALIPVTKDDIERKKDEVQRLEKELQQGDAELRQRSKFVVLLGAQVKDMEREVNGKDSELAEMNKNIADLMVGIKEMDETSDALREEILQVEEESKRYMRSQNIQDPDLLLAESGSMLDKLMDQGAEGEDGEEANSIINKFDELAPLVEGVVEVVHENSACFFKVPKVHTFGHLLQDSIKYWNVQIEKVGLEDDEGRVWASTALVWTEMSQSERYKSGQIPQMYLRFKELEEAEEEEDGDWMTKKKKEAIEIVKEMDAAEEMRQEETLRLRSQAQRELMFFMIFVLAFVIVTLSWRDTLSAYTIAHAIRTAALDEDFPSSVTHIQKNFHDVANSEEMWQYVDEVFTPAMNLGTAEDMGGHVSEYNRLVGTIRLRQKRVGEGKDCTVPAKYDAYPDLGCYSVYTDAANSNAPYGPNSIWQADSGNSLTKSVSGRLATYPVGGFTLDFPLEQTNFTSAMKELQAKEWVDKATRVVFIEFITYNVNFNMFTCCQIIFEYSAGGLVYPWSRFLPLTLTTEEPFWTGAFGAIMKFLYYVYLLYFTKRFYDEFKASRLSTDPPSCCNFWLEGWNWHELVILVLAFLTVLLTLMFYMDPLRDDLQIESTTQWQDLFPMAEYAEMIIQFNAILALLIFWKIFKYFNLSSRFLALSKTLTTAFPEVFVFLIMFAIVFVGYGIMANLLFGTSLVQYSSFERTLITLFLVTLGDFDYTELEDVTRIFAPIFFFSFIVFVFFVLLNMFIGIINEAYAVESQKPKKDVTDEFIEFLADLKENITRPIKEFMELAKEKIKMLKEEEEKFRMMRNAEIRRENMGRGMIAKFEKNEQHELAEISKKIWLLPTRLGMEDYIRDINLDRIAKEDAKGNEKKPQEKLTERQELKELLSMLEENIDEARMVLHEVIQQGMQGDVNMFEVETAACETLVEEFQDAINEKTQELAELEQRLKDEKSAKDNEEEAAPADGERV
eukprot:TRINITY_DN2824_c0_g2_i2.p1 TRINITY_DN2824_c0_g2~~TRINITY_DN2824_c0_g2_i2.p1  ORF type:complete len:968 (+),score=269.08 TRINITY_DN2824_c0_g2_i2:88-2991(+)